MNLEAFIGDRKGKWAFREVPRGFSGYQTKRSQGRFKGVAGDYRRYQKVSGGVSGVLRSISGDLSGVSVALKDVSF